MLVRKVAGGQAGVHENECSDVDGWVGSGVRQYVLNTAAPDRGCSLGDRHCDNIMLDEGTGEVMHCDLNCIFWKGLTFAAPECVPFRMTQNLEEALGVTKCEGMFRRVCSRVIIAPA